MSLRSSIGGTPVSSRLRQPFKSPLQSPASTKQTENGNASPAVKGNADEKDQNSNGIRNQTSTPPLAKMPYGRSPSDCITPQKMGTGQSPAVRDCRRKLATGARQFSTPFRSPRFTQSPQQTSALPPKEQLAQLMKKEEELDQEIKSLQESGYKSEELQDHISNLHRYNEVKDTAQLVLGRLAEMENATLKEMHEKYEAPAGE